MEIMENPKKNRIFRWTSPSAWILVIAFLISLFTLIIYFQESDFSDETLYLLLTILRYSSFLVCICAFYKILINIFRIRHLRLVSIIKIIINFLFILYGFGIIFLETLIVVIAGGT